MDQSVEVKEKRLKAQWSFCSLDIAKDARAVGKARGLNAELLQHRDEQIRQEKVHRIGICRGVTNAL